MMSTTAPVRPQGDGATSIQAAPAPEAPAPAGPKVWRTGTLTYDRKGLAWLMSWLFWGDIGLALKDRSLSSVVRALLQQYGASNLMVATLTQTIPSILNMLLGPIISYKSDRFRSRYGRRRPFLFLAVPLTAASIVGMAFVPQMARAFESTFGAAPLGINSSIWCFGFLWIIFDVASVVAGTVNSGYWNDVVPKEIMGRVFAFTRLISLVIGAVFMFQFFGKMINHATAILLTVGLLYGVGWLSAVVAVREGEYPDPDEGRRPPSRIEATISYFKTCFSQPYYLFIFLGTVINGCIAHGAVNQWSQYYATSMGISLDGYGKLDAICYIMAIPMAPVIGWLADKFHPLRMTMLTIALHMPLALLGGFLIHDQTTFSVFFILISSMQFCFGSAVPSLYPKLIPQASFTQFVTAAGLVYFVFNLVYSSTLGKILDLNGGNYSIAFIIAGIGDGVALVFFYLVYRKFMKLGGPKAYVAP